MILPIYLLIIALVLILVWSVKYMWSRKELYVAASKMNGPTPLPLIGNALYFICKDEDILYTINNITKQYESPMRFWLGSELLVASLEPSHVEKVLCSTKFVHKHDLYKFVKNYLGEGLVSGSGPNYKKHRRIIQPMVNLKFCVHQIEIMQRYTEICMDNLEKFVDKGTFDIQSVTHKCFIDIIGETILGSKINCQQNGYNAFCRAATDMYSVGFTRLTRPWLHPDFIYRFTSNKKQEDQIIQIIHEFLSTIIIESWQRRSLNGYQVTETSPIIDQIADYISHNPNSINSTDFISHLITLFAAAEDTMTIISSFVAVCLGMNPEYQEKAAQEIRFVFGETPREVTYEDITKLDYLDMCIKEVQRICPIAPYILRKSFEEVEIDSTWTIPRGCCVVVPIYNLHRDPKLWENPNDFYPDHFLPDKVANRHPFAFLPFSAGPRGCIGKIYSNICSKIFLANLLQRFEIEADGKFSDIKLKMDISTRPINGYKLRLKKRVWKK